jgi:hypothetical protein
MKGTESSVSAANRLGLDYRAEALRLGPPPAPITDVHTHVNGAKAAQIYREVMDLYGIERTTSQTRLSEVSAVKRVLGDRVEFIAVPNFMSKDKAHAFRDGFLEDIQTFHDEHGARMIKLWAAPRMRDFAEEVGEDVIAVDAPWRVRAAELAESLGMMFMTHVGDPDTWFATKYADAAKYGTKQDQYLPLERMLDRFTSPWIAAHMGGWPENLSFLSGLLSRHDNLVLDTSATKWMVRELSKHPREELVEFLQRWDGRILFGSDVVTTDEHLKPSDSPHPMGTLAGSASEAFDLYAGRYWALRTLFETDYDGQSPIADPDLKMVDPAKHDEMSAPRLHGKRVPAGLLGTLYRDAAERIVFNWIRSHSGQG